MSILVLSENGKIVKKNITLAQAAVAADLVGKTVIANTEQAVSTAITWPTDRALEFQEGGYVTFSGSGALTGLKESRPEWFMPLSPTATEMTTAFNKSGAIGCPVYLQAVTYEINAPVVMKGFLAGSLGETTIINLTGAGSITFDTRYTGYSDIIFQSTINNKTFITVDGVSNFSAKRYKFMKGNDIDGYAATGQIGINFDITNGDIYFADIDDFKMYLDYPVKVTGSATLARSFNANKLGGTIQSSWQGFKSAITLVGADFNDANHIAGYFEEGDVIIDHQSGTYRQNRLDAIADKSGAPLMITYKTIAPALDGVDDVNEWKVLGSEGFVVDGTYPLRQIIIPTVTTKVRATNTAADTIPTASPTVMKYDTETFDVLSEFAIGNGTFTARNPGYYQINAAAKLVSDTYPNGARVELRVYKNDTHYTTGQVIVNTSGGAITGTLSVDVTTTVYLNGATDYITVKLVQTSGNTVALNGDAANNWIEVIKLLQ